MQRRFFIQLMPLLISMGLTFPASGDGPVMEWVEVQTGANKATYLAELEGVLARMKQVRPEMRSRVFTAAYAGPRTGVVHVLNEFPDLEYFAASLRELEKDPKYLAGLEALRKTGRIIKGESLLFEVAPFGGQDKPR